MHVEITGVRRGSTSTAVKIDTLVVPFVQALRDAYIAAGISDDESATGDMLTDILVYAHNVEGAEPQEIASRAARAAWSELHAAQSGE